MVTTVKVVNVSKRKSAYRTTYRFSFDSRAPIDRGPFYAATLEQAELNAANMIPAIDVYIEEKDAAKAVYNGDSITSNIIARQYFKIAMQSDFIDGYFMLKKARDYITKQGWTLPQVKERLSLTDKQWLSITNRYEYFKANAPAIEAFAALTDPRGKF